MNKERKIVSKRLEDVWTWKESVYRDVSNLPTDQALDKILEKAHQAALKHGFILTSRKKASAFRETIEGYKKSKD